MQHFLNAHPAGDDRGISPTGLQLQAVRDDLAYWRQHRDQLVAAGAKQWGPADFAVGDRVGASYGMCTVERVNAKSVSVRPDVMPEVLHTLPYHKVRENLTARQRDAPGDVTVDVATLEERAQDVASELPGQPETDRSGP